MTDSSDVADRSLSRRLAPLLGACGRVERAVRRGGRALAESHPALRRSILSLWDAYILAYVGFRSGWDALRYARRTSLDPFRVARVDLDRIEYVVEADGYPEQTRAENVFSTPKFKHAGTVLAGDWDQTDRRFEETDVYRAFAARFLHGVPWEETRFYRRCVAHIEDGVTMWGCTTETAFRRRCAYLDDLHATIAEEGYLSQLELSDSAGPDSDDPDPAEPNPEPPDAEARNGEESAAETAAAEGGLRASEVVRLVNDELTVAVGREGDLLFVDGRNRLAIAKVLDLDAVPVWIVARHERWQQFRERLAAEPALFETLPPALRDHPDLASIRDRSAE